MRATVGDRLVIEGRALGTHRRQGVVVGPVHEDGSPPFPVRRVDDSQESLVLPGPEARIEQHPMPPPRGVRRASDALGAAQRGVCS